MKYDIYERNIPNTFAPTCENKMFSISDIVGGLKFGIFEKKNSQKTLQDGFGQNMPEELRKRRKNLMKKRKKSRRTR